jgi:hypothetical protein
MDCIGFLYRLHLFALSRSHNKHTLTPCTLSHVFTSPLFSHIVGRKYLFSHTMCFKANQMLLSFRMFSLPQPLQPSVSSKIPPHTHKHSHSRTHARTHTLTQFLFFFPSIFELLLRGIYFFSWMSSYLSSSWDLFQSRDKNVSKMLNRSK